MPLFSESNSCSIEPTRIALHIFCLRKAEMEALPNDNLSRSALAEQFGDIAEMEQRRGSVSAQHSKMAGSNQCNVGNGRKMCSASPFPVYSEIFLS